MPWFSFAPRSPVSNSLSNLRRKAAKRRLRRLFLEPLEDRRLLTYGWGSTSASGSLPGYDWGPSYASVEWLESDTDDDGILDSAASISVQVLEDEGTAEGGRLTLRMSASAPFGSNWETVSGEIWVEGFTAAAGTDFTLSNSQWLTGWNFMSVNVATSNDDYIDILTDSEVEPGESLKIHLRYWNQPSTEVVLEGKILGDESETSVGFSAQTTAAIEGNNVLLSTSSDLPLSFEYWVEDVYDSNWVISAQSGGTDYTDPGSSSSTQWVAIDSSNQVSFPTNDDSEAEGAESFKIHVRVVGQPATEMILEADILDNEITNNLPIAVDDEYNTAEDTPLELTPPGILGNDTDVDQDPLTAYFTVGPVNGVLSLAADGSFTYTPGANYNGDDGFAYQASDGLELSNEALVTISIIADNDAPLAAADSYATAQDIALAIQPAAGVLLNDTDTENDSLTAVIAANPAHGTVTLDTNGGFTYTPTASYYGADSFTYRASDGQLDSTPAVVTITIPQALPPVAQPNTYQTNVNTPLTVVDPGVLGNDTDANNDDIDAILVAGASHGTVVLQEEDGSFTYTPNTNYLGSDSFTYKANDGRQSPTGDSNTTTVTINVGPDSWLFSFQGDGGSNLKVNYFNYGALPAAYPISIYASADGVTLGDQLATTTASTAAGLNSWVIPVNFQLPAGDYYLIAKADPAGSITEYNESNNLAKLTHYFRTTEPDGTRVLHVHGSDSSETFNASITGGQLFLESNNFVTQTYDPATIDEIRYHAHGGNDTITIDSALDKSTTQYGGIGNDTLYGGALHDIIFGGLGNDSIYGNAGNDQIEGDDGSDVLTGGLGNDTIVGGLANDNLFGEGGDDILFAGEGDDLLQGDDGRDTLLGEAGQDTQYGGAGDDYLNGGDDSDTLDGGSGNDNLVGEDGDDTLTGGIGDDSLEGGDGADDLAGGDGNDMMGGGAGNDGLDGGTGIDGLYGGDGDDTMSPGGQTGDSSDQTGDPPPAQPNLGTPIVSVFSATTPEGTGIGVGGDPGDSQGIPVSITLSRELLPGETGSVVFTIAGVTAVAGTDFYKLDGNVLTGTINFDQNTSYDFFYIWTVPDDVTESNETLTITLSSPQGVQISGEHGSATGTIDDDDDNGVSAFNDGEADADGYYPYWTFDEGELAVSAEDGVIQNSNGADIDYDPNAPEDDLEAHLVDNAMYGNVSLSSDGSFVYYPTTPFVGIDFFTYYAQASDGRQSAPAKVFVARERLIIEAQTRGSGDFDIIGGITFVQGNSGKIAWAGQAIDLRANVWGPPVATPFEAGAKFAWTTSDKVIAGYSVQTTLGQSNGSVVPFDDVARTSPEPKVYWVDQGLKTVQVSVTRPGKAPVTASGQIRINKPSVQVTTVTTHVFDEAQPNNSGHVAQFGSLDLPNMTPKKKGIEFTVTEQPGSPQQGTFARYKWVQLISSDAHRQGPTSQSTDGWYRTTPGFVLDRDYPYATGSITSDSPLEAWSSTYYSIYRYDDFEMYLMWVWREIDPDAIPVPLQIVPWYWNFDATYSEAFGWTVNGANSPFPSGQDTTEFPEWTRNFNAFLEWEHDD